MTPSPSQSPTVLRRRLGSELKRLREAAGLTATMAAEKLDWSTSKVSRVETGRVHVRPYDVDKALQVYLVADDEREVLHKLALQAREKGWWHRYNDVLPEWFDMYLGLEAEACSVQNYEAEVVPGLLQTEDYARAVLVACPVPDTPDEIDRQVELRMERQDRLRSPEKPLKLHAIINEAALRRPIGGWKVMRAQYRRMAETIEWPMVSLQVLSFDSGAHAGIMGPFVILEFPEPEDPRVVYFEYLTGSLYLERLKEVGRYRLAFSQLSERALSRDASLELVAKLATET